MEYYYTYWITNIKTGQGYIGKRKSNRAPENDLSIKYFSSSSVKEFINDQKVNPNDYKYKILQTFDSPKELIDHEIELHEKYDVAKNPMFYNKAKQTSSGFDTTGTTYTPEAKAKRSAASKKYWADSINRAKQSAVLKKALSTPEAKANQSAAVLKQLQDLEYKDRRSASIKKSRSTKKSKAKTSAGSIGRKWINNRLGEYKFVKADQLEDYLNSGWVLGAKKGTLESKAKQSATHKKRYEDPTERAKTSAATKNKKYKDERI